MRHYEIPLPFAPHQWCYVQPTDPALDPSNAVTRDKAWFDTSENRLKFRNETNTAWLYVGIGGIET